MLDKLYKTELVRRLAVPFVAYFTRNIFYVTQFGNIKIRRKGGIDFLVLRQDPQEERFLTSLDYKGKVIYDVGAYKGIFTAFFSKSVGDSGRVIAFEPHPDNFIEVRKTVEVNHLNNVDVLNVGIAENTGTVTLAVRYNSTGTSSMDPSIKSQILSERYTGLLHAAIDTLDHCIVANNLPPPNFIKIDIEGMEYNALKGMDKTIRQYLPEIYIEIHGVDKVSKEANIKRIMELLQSYEYEVFHIESGKTISKETVELAMEGHIFCKHKAYM